LSILKKQKTKTKGKQWKNRNEVVKEIISSEISYIYGLHTIIDVFFFFPFSF